MTCVLLIQMASQSSLFKAAYRTPDFPAHHALRCTQVTRRTTNAVVTAGQ